MRAIGLMSGTSLDGIDAALVDLRAKGEGYAVETIAFRTLPFEGALLADLTAALPPNEPSPREVAMLDTALGCAFAAAAASVDDGNVDFVASHGLTLFHEGRIPVTLQIGDPYAIRERVGATVVFDFRRADVAAGGQGAPLVPHVDRLLFRDDARDVAALNLGGIANVTILLRSGAAPRAWDTGPGNMLIDAFVRRRSAGAMRYDDGGAHAARGSVDADVLEELMRDRYFSEPPPKSTGRERFGTGFLHCIEPLLAPLSLEDGCATLTAFTARSIRASLDAYGAKNARIVASGGGVHNATLMRMLRESHELVTADAYGIDPDAKEAVAFAILGLEALRGRAAGIPSATGSRHATILGAIAPAGLGRLLENVSRDFPAAAS